MNICFYPSVNKSSGLGHLKRSILLTKFFPKFNIFFLYKNFKELLISQDIPQKKLINFKNYKNLNFKYTIIDNYKVNLKDLRDLKRRSQFLILLYDQKQRLDFIDILIHSSKNQLKLLIIFFKLISLN